MKTLTGIWLTAIIISLTHSAQAAPDMEPASKEHIQKLLQPITSGTITVVAVNDTPVTGIKEAIIKNGNTQEIIYVSDNGEFMFDGNLMNIKQRSNLTEQTQKSLRTELMNSFKANHKTIDFLPEEMTDHITVFTDIDCGYCRKLHQEIEDYNDLGIGVSYLFFPRSGLNTASHQKAVNVWCADDQQQAMTLAKGGQNLPPLQCDNPIESQFNLGIGAGVHKVGTPAVMFSDGTLMPGYLPAAQMKQRIAQTKTNQ